MKRQAKTANGSSPDETRTTNETQKQQDVDTMEDTLKGSSRSYQIFHKTVMPAALMIWAPNMVMVLWYMAVFCNGSFQELLVYFKTEGFLQGIADIWRSAEITSFSVSLLACFCALQLLLMRFVPGKEFEGPLTSKGNIPVYRDNGFRCYIINMGLFAILTVILKQHGSSTTIVYDRFGDILLTLNIFSFMFCLLLYIKGITRPSTTDSGSSHNILYDIYWGTELYPRISGFDVKVFTNCRFGMTVWPLLVAIHALKSYELHGFVDSMFVSAFLQLLYVTKFFTWEAGYMKTIDIMVDRAGFMICWGCLVFIPGYYTSPTMYLVTHPVHLGTPLTICLLVVGSVSIYTNYCADAQKQEVRRTNGDCLVWGAKPKVIEAKYKMVSGETKGSILLVCGFWGLARHFNYLPELMLAFCWSVPAGFSHLMPYSYFILLVILLTHRSYRDDRRCSNKYGEFWVEYCQKVPHRIIPGLF